MKSMRVLLIAACLISLGAYMGPKANAGDLDEKSMLTFDQPVELPGVVLPAGTYIFKLVDSPVDRHIVQVLSADERTIYATINAIPKLRYNAPENTLIVYEDRAAGAPRAIKEWFYPDRRVGHEFVYSKVEPGQLARTEPSQMKPSEESPSAVAETEDSSYMQALHERQAGESSTAAASVGPEMPAEHTDYMQLLQEKQSEPGALARVDEPEAQSSNDMAELQSSSAPHEMPKTASNLPLIGLSGALLVIAGAGLRLCSKRIS